MAIVISVLTPDWMLQVSDAPGGTPRTVKLQRLGAPGLLAWAGDPAWLDAVWDELQRREASDPSELASWLATELGARCPADDPLTALLGGWGVSPEGHKASWRWRVSNFELEATDAPFAIDGTWLVPAYAQPGHRGRARATTSFSVQVSCTEAIPTAIQRGIDKLPRDLRAKIDPSDLALRMVGWVRSLYLDTPAVMALLRPDASLEGGVIDGDRVVPLHAPAEDGLHRLTSR